MQIGLGIGIPFSKSQVWLAVQAVFTPANLFDSGANGLWLDPSDLTTMFQDSAGTTPVTAVEQPVGLILDKSKGLVLGPELVTNGNFSNGTTGWSGQANVTISTENGELKGVTSSSSSTFAYQDEVTVSGKWYKATATLRCASGDMRLEIYNGAFATKLAGAILTTPTANTQISIYFVATGTSTRISFGTTTSAATTYYADNISVRELSGNHAFQSTSANRPTLSARYNLLTKTEDISSADWTAYLIASRTSNTFIPSAAGGEHYVSNSTSKITGAIQYAARFDVKDAGYGFSPIVVGDWNGTNTSNGWYFCVDLSSGSYTIPATFGNGWSTGTVSVIRDVSTGICTVSLVFTTSAVSTRVGIGVYAYTSLKASSPYTFSGNGSSGIYCSKISLVQANQSSLPYQRVNTATDYDSVGFKPYLLFNGTSSSMQTNSIDFTATDKMFVSAGVRKLSDAAPGTLLEQSSNVVLNAGTVLLRGPYTAASNFAFLSKGSVLSDAISAGVYPSPITNVITGIGNISGDQVLLRVNGTQAAINTADQGAGNYGNYPLYIGARAGTSLYFNGRLHQLVVTGKQASASEITNTETFINQKTGAY